MIQDIINGQKTIQDALMSSTPEEKLDLPWK